jgi:hypothetical protein
MTWGEVLFFVRLTFIQSPVVLILAGNGLCGYWCLFLVKFDANVSLCNTQQRYSPLGRGGVIRRRAAPRRPHWFGRVSTSLHYEFAGPASPTTSGYTAQNLLRHPPSILLRNAAARCTMRVRGWPLALRRTHGD